MIGGVSKALASEFTLNTITFSQIFEVSIYAGISAFVGYLVKLGIDTLRKRYFSNSNTKA